MTELKPCPNPWCESHKTTDPEIRAAHRPIFVLTMGAVACPVCPVQTPYFDAEAQAITAWNTRAADAEIARLRAEVERLSEELRKAQLPDWFYYGDDHSSDQCRDSIDGCITEDFEWDNGAEGNHVLQISGARPVPDMWIALHYFTEAEKDDRGDDEPYAYTVHTSQEDAQRALDATFTDPLAKPEGDA